VIRSIDRKLASLSQILTVAKYAPAVFVDPATKQPAIFHQDGRPVNKDEPANRDDRLVIYATGLGPIKGVRLVSGTPAPAGQVAETDPVQVFFGDPRYREAAMDVEWSGLTPGFIGLYQINIYVPWYRMKGQQPVTVRVGGVDSSSQTPLPPVVALE
jgi:uncharacterized protein (TIGR03437 family)